MYFAKKRKIMGVSLIALISVTSLTSCAAFEALPDEERYFYIDKVLSDIDYQNIGEVTSKVKDEGDGVFVASYKSVGYDDPEVFDKIAKRLSSQDDPHVNHNCIYHKDATLLNCTYYGTVISMSGGPGGTSIKVSDPSSGRK